MLGMSKKVSFQADNLRKGDIIALDTGKGEEVFRCAVYEVTKRLFRAIILMSKIDECSTTGIWQMQIYDLEAAISSGARWRLVK